MDNIELKYNVQERYSENVKDNISAAALVNALMGIKIPYDELIKKCNEKSKDEIQKKLDGVIKAYKELKNDKKAISELNNKFKEIGSDFRIRQFITITEDLVIRDSKYLCGNGYFKEIYNINGFFIPALNYANYDLTCYDDETIEEMKAWSKEYIYFFEESESDIKLPIKNINDGIDYTKDFIEICLQVMNKYKVGSNQDIVDCVYFQNEDRKIDFYSEIQDLTNILMCGFGQKTMREYDTKYNITLKEIGKITKDIQCFCI